MSNVSLQAHQEPAFEGLLHKAGTETWPIEEGPDIITGSQLPSHSDVHYSILSDKRIQV